MAQQLTAIDYPLPSFYFSVDFGSRKSLSFQEVSGIKLTVKYKQEDRQQGDTVTQHKVFDKIEHSTVTFKKGLTKSNSMAIELLEDLFNISLLNSTTSQTVRPQTVNITLKDETGQESLMVTLVGAYPTAWEISAFDAMSKELTIETLQLEYRSMRIKYN